MIKILQKFVCIKRLILSMLTRMMMTNFVRRS